MITLFSFIIVIGVIVFVHEFGHFIAAKLSGVRVEIFSLGFPPKMIGKKIGETEYQLAWIPLGGFVKMSGMMDESFDDEFDPDDPHGFVAQSFMKRVFIITAGVIMNFILAFVLYTGLTMVEGVGTVTGNTITQVSQNSPAEELGIRENDKIIEINNTAVEDWNSLTDLIRANPGVPIDIKWISDDSLHSGVITPESKPALNFIS